MLDGDTIVPITRHCGFYGNPFSSCVCRSFCLWGEKRFKSFKIDGDKRSVCEMDGWMDVEDSAAARESIMPENVRTGTYLVLLEYIHTVGQGCIR